MKRTSGFLLVVLLLVPVSINAMQYARVAIVAESGGNYVHPLHAMNDLSSWCDQRSETERCLLKIMPGVYSMGTSALVMQSYVDVEGSGEKTTVLHGYQNPLRGANSSQIRHLTIKAGSAIAVSPWGMDNRYGSPEIRNVTVEVQGTTTPVGIMNSQSSPVLRDVAVNVTGGTEEPRGIWNSDSLAVMKNVVITVTGQSTSITFGLRNDGALPPEMNNVKVAVSGGRINFGIYTGSGSVYSPLKMFDVTATAAGGAGSWNRGIYNEGTTEMVRVTAEASGGSDNRAISNHGLSSKTVMADVVARASGASYNVGVYNQFNDQNRGRVIEMKNLTADASGGSDRNYGIFNDAPSAFSGGIVRIDHSSVAGTTETIHNVSNGKMACAPCRITLRTAYTKLDGGPVNTSGTLSSIICVGVYNGSYAVLNGSCQ